MSTGIVRAPRPQRDYLDVHNSTIRDARLSFRARGVLIRLLSNADGYSMTAEDLAAEGKEGRDAIRKALKELRAAGYIVVDKRQNKLGQWSTQTLVFDTPPTPENPASGCPAVGGSGPVHQNYQENYQTPTTTPPKARGGGGERQNTRPPKSKTPAPVAAEAGDRDEELAQALDGISLAECCDCFQDQIAAAAVAAKLDRVGTQKLADALAGAIEAPEGDPARLKNRRDPSRWLARTASAIRDGEFVAGRAYAAALAARQARQAAARGGARQEQDEDWRRRRLEESASHVPRDADAVAAGAKLLAKTRRNARGATIVASGMS